VIFLLTKLQDFGIFKKFGLKSRISSMSREKALKILDIKNDTPSEEEVKAAYHKMMVKNHPDQGGSEYLASKINEARDVLLKG
jgi:DnaJ family protein C protein 19